MRPQRNSWSHDIDTPHGATSRPWASYAAAECVQRQIENGCRKQPHKNLLQAAIGMDSCLTAHLPARLCLDFLLPNEIGEVRVELLLEPSNMTEIVLGVPQYAEKSAIPPSTVASACS